MSGGNSRETAAGAEDRAGDSAASFPGPSGSLQGCASKVWDAVLSSCCPPSPAPRSDKWGCGQLKIKWLLVFGMSLETGCSPPEWEPGKDAAARRAPLPKPWGTISFEDRNNPEPSHGGSLLLSQHLELRGRKTAAS